MSKNMTIRRTIQVFSACFALVLGVLVVGTLLFQKGGVEKTIAEGSDTAKKQVLETAREATAVIARDVLRMCRAQQEAVQQKVDYDLNVARDMLNRAGAVSFADETATWQAVNQYTKVKSTEALPRMMVGDTWLGQNADMSIPSPVVDPTRDLVGGTCTIFQRMNEAGDMLRVCTNVEKLDQTRAVGTFIPAVNPDGTSNPVISVVLKGETYRGRAYVVNAWYITAYEPILNASGKVVGVLYVGVKQENVENLRTGIMETVVGKTGYVYVLGGKGDQRGHYIISKGGGRDGEDILGAKDSDGVLFIQEIVEKAVALEFAAEGEIPVDYQMYPWKNEGEDEARMKIAAIAYFEPWDWVIGAGCYEDDFAETQKAMDASFGVIIDMFSQMIWRTLGIVAFLVVGGVFLAGLFAKRITKRLNATVESLTATSDQVTSASGQVAQSSTAMAEGASEQASSLEETSASLEEITSMTRQNMDNSNEAKSLAEQAQADADTGSEAMQRMSQAINEIKKSADETAGIVKTIEEIAFQTNLLALNAAVEAARAGDAGKGFAVVAEEVRNLAQRAAEAARNTGALITGSVKSSENGVAISKEVAESLGKIAEGTTKVNQITSEVAAASNEQAQGIDQINTAVSQMDQVTQSNAANSEEGASAAEELSAQAAEMMKVVDDLAALVGGGRAVSTAASTGGAPKGGAPHAVHAGLPAPTPRPGKALVAHGKAGQKVVKPEEVLPLDDEDMGDF